MLKQLDDPEWLMKQYETQSLQVIADSLGICRNTVRNRFIEFGIPRRATMDWAKGKPKSVEQKAKFSEARQKHWERLTPEEHRSVVTHISIGKRTKDGVSTKGRRIYIYGRGRIFEHRYVAEQMLGRPLESSEHVHHIDGNRLNNDPSNLKVVSNLEHQTYHAQKLTENDVHEIREAWNNHTMSQAGLSRKYGVAVVTIHRIVHHKRWKGR